MEDEELGVHIADYDDKEDLQQDVDVDEEGHE